MQDIILVREGYREPRPWGRFLLHFAIPTPFVSWMQERSSGDAFACWGMSAHWPVPGYETRAHTYTNNTTGFNLMA